MPAMPANPPRAVCAADPSAERAADPSAERAADPCVERAATMPASLAAALTVTDLVFLAYWGAASLAALGLIALPASLLFAGYHEPRVLAWNWSFLPLDIAFSLTGLAAVRAGRRARPIWRPLALISLLLTMVAGGMAVSYWALLGEFDPGWFLPNLALLVWPAPFLLGLVRGLARG